MGDAAQDLFGRLTAPDLIDDLPVSLIVYSPEGLIIAMNRRAEALWGAQREIVIGVFNILTDQQSVAQGSHELFRRVLAGERVTAPPVPFDTSQVNVETADRIGRQMWIQAESFPIRGGAGEVIGVGIIHQDITEEVGRQQALETAREEIDQQREAIETLSSPVIEVWDGVLTMPLVGYIDARRAMGATERLLEAIVARQADIVLIDITGVPVIDTAAASALMAAARAVRLLGSRVALVGMNAEMAQTLVSLSVDLSAVTTLANLKAGIDWAFREQGFVVTRQP